MEHPRCVEPGSKRPHVQHMATLADLSPHVWALVLRNATVHDLFVVAHVCRELHEIIVSSDACTCVSNPDALASGAPDWCARSRTFWTHWSDVHPPPSFDEWEAHVQCGHVAHFALALRCGVDPSSGYQSALFKASKYGHLAVVKLLLRDWRVDPSAHAQYAIRTASGHGHVEVVDRLLRDSRVDPIAADHEAIRWASEKGHVKVVDRLLRDPRVDPGARNQDAILRASFEGHVAVVDRLLRDARVDPSADKQGALRWACGRGHVAVVERLLRDERVARDVEALCKCILMARSAGHDDIVTLLEHRPHVQRVGTLTDLPPHVWALVLRDATVHDLFVVAHVCRALHELITSTAVCTCVSIPEVLAFGVPCLCARSRAFWAHWRDVHPPPPADEWKAHARCGHVAHIALALHCGGDPNAGHLWALFKASEYGHLAIVNLLLHDDRVDPSAWEQCFIGLASQHGHVDVVDRLLRDARVDPSADHQYAVRWASRKGHVAVVHCLLRDARVDPGACDQHAIQWASTEGRVAVVDRLLCDPRVDPSADGQCAMRWACLRGRVAVVECLLRDERVARDVAAMRGCITTAREKGHDDIVTLLERHCTSLGAGAAS